MQGIYLLMSEFKKYNHQHYYLLSVFWTRVSNLHVLLSHLINTTTLQGRYLQSVFYRWENWSLQKWFAQRHIALSNTVKTRNKARFHTKAWAKQELKPMQYFKLKIWSIEYFRILGFNTIKRVKDKISIT